MVPFQGVSRTVANQSSLGVVNVVPFEDFATSCTEGRKSFQNHHNVIPSLLGMSKHVLAPVGISFDVMACCACAFLMQCAWKSRQDCCRICMWIYYIYMCIIDLRRGKKKRLHCETACAPSSNQKHPTTHPHLENTYTNTYVYIIRAYYIVNIISKKNLHTGS